MHDLAVLLHEEREEELLRELSDEDLERAGGGLSVGLKCISPDPEHPVDCDIDVL